MTDKANTTEEQHKTPLELVHEQQQRQQQALNEGRAQADGQSMKAHSDQVENHPDATPEVPGAGTPSSMRTHPQRRNHSHGE